MACQLIRAFLLLGLAVSAAENSNSDSESSSVESEERIPYLIRSPSPAANSGYFSPRDAVIQASPVQWTKTGSFESLEAIEKQKRRYYDPQIFLPLGIDDIKKFPSTRNNPESSEIGYTALENSLKPDIEVETVELALASGDQNLVVKSLASLFLAIILLLVYNVVFLHVLD